MIKKFQFVEKISFNPIEYFFPEYFLPEKLNHFNLPKLRSYAARVAQYLVQVNKRHLFISFYLTHNLVEGCCWDRSRVKPGDGRPRPQPPHRPRPRPRPQEM